MLSLCLESLYKINHISPMKNLRNSLKIRNFVVLNNLYLAQHSTAQHSTALYYANIVGYFVCLLFLKSKPAYGISIGRLAFL